MEQNQNTEPAVQVNKKSVLVTIIVVLLFLLIIFNLGWLIRSVYYAYTIHTPYGLYTATTPFAEKFWDIINPQIWHIVGSFILIFIAIGLLKMKKWAWYGYLILFALDIIIPSLITHNPDWVFGVYPLIVFTGPLFFIILIYLLINRKQFN